MITPDRLTWPEIRSKAEDLRKLVGLTTDSIPVDVTKIVEIHFNIQVIPVPNLLSEQDIDGFLTSDRSSIYIDELTYMNSRFNNRLRFTFGHELGHYILHEEFYNAQKFQDVNDWIKVRSEFDEDALNWFEQQAHEFAGRLLVPKPALLSLIKEYDSQVKQFYHLSKDNTHEPVIRMIARLIANKFEVSEGVIVRRINSENIWEELGYR